MKLFCVDEVEPKDKKYMNLMNGSTQMIIDICEALKIPLVSLHCALWVFQCTAIISTFHDFDRYMYSCGAVLVGTKITEYLKNPIEILRECRKILRKKKKLAQEDTDDYLKKLLKRLFEAEVTLMINFGFDFDIKLALTKAEEMNLSGDIRDQQFYSKFKQTLTSLYRTEVVVMYDPMIMIGMGLDIVLKAERINLAIMDYSESLKSLIESDEVKEAKNEYLMRCGLT